MNKATGGGETPLSTACFSGHIRVAKLLIDRGADINKANDNNGWTPLHCACCNGYKHIAKLLIMRGADVSRKDTNGDTMFEVACYSGHDDIIDFLIAAVDAKEMRASEARSPTYT